jgi:glycosyltransferase involved in cell wall biosynthesis
MTKCTVAIPVFNRRELVHATLASALSQNVRDLEILVIDNCSTDGTWESLQAYEDPRLRRVRNERNIGLFGNFNRCLELARGTYVQFLCSDDRLMPGCLGEQVRIMDAHENVALLSTAGRFVDRSGKPCGHLADHFDAGVYPGERAILSWFWYFSHYGYNPLNYPSGVMLRREAALRAGRFDEALRSVGDVDFFLRILEKADLAVSKEIGCEILLHEGQQSVPAALDGSSVREHLAGLERHRGLLENQGCYEGIRRQLSAIAFDTAVTCWRLGSAEAMRGHMKLIRDSGFGPPSAALAWSRMHALRLLLRTTGIRFTRLPPPRPLR